MLRASHSLGGNGVCGEDDMAEQPSTEPDKQLSLASRNPISITVAGSGRREGEWGGQLSLAASCPALGRDPRHPGVPCGLGAPSATLVLQNRVPGEPGDGTEPHGLCCGHPGVAQGGCCPGVGALAQGWGG